MTDIDEYEDDFNDEPDAEEVNESEGWDRED